MFSWNTAFASLPVQECAVLPGGKTAMHLNPSRHCLCWLRSSWNPYLFAACLSFAFLFPRKLLVTSLLMSSYTSKLMQGSRTSLGCVIPKIFQFYNVIWQPETLPVFLWCLYKGAVSSYHHAIPWEVINNFWETVVKFFSTFPPLFWFICSLLSLLGRNSWPLNQLFTVNCKISGSREWSEERGPHGII